MCLGSTASSFGPRMDVSKASAGLGLKDYDMDLQDFGGLRGAYVKNWG